MIDNLDNDFEEIALHFFCHVLKFDYRSIFLSEDSTLDDFIVGFSKFDYLEVAKQYKEEVSKKNYSYTQSHYLYKKIYHDYWEQLIKKRVLHFYNVDLTKISFKIREILYKDVLLAIQEKNPTRDFSLEHQFTIQKLDKINIQEDEDLEKITNHLDLHSIKNNKSTNVKSIDGKFLDINSCYDPKKIMAHYIYIKQPITMQEAVKISYDNIDRHMQGKIYVPYEPS